MNRGPDRRSRSSTVRVLAGLRAISDCHPTLSCLPAVLAGNDATGPRGSHARQHGPSGISMVPSNAACAPLAMAADEQRLREQNKFLPDRPN
jgi:hypothetical protein